MVRSMFRCFNFGFGIAMGLSGLVAGCGLAQIKREPTAAFSDSKISEQRRETSEMSKTSDKVQGADVSQVAASSEVIEQPGVDVSERRMRIPIELNESVRYWITYFSEKDKDRFQRFLDRGQAYRDVVENTLEENDLPAELYYLAMIESGFRTDAHSRAKAVGVWQFVSGTARRYGLRIDRHVDERRDPIRATEAAAKYLRDLYNVFGSWHLAMAAYNAGEIRILRAVFKGRTRNFWELIQAKTLPRETSEYVPKFLAVALIGQNPEKYGFKSVATVESYPSLEAIEVPGSLELSQLAAKSGLSLELLAKVNPHLNSARTPPASSYEVWIPVEAAEIVRNLQPTLSRLAPRRQESLGSRIPSSSVGIHVVRRGDTLDEIARKYKLSVGHLMRVNDLSSSRIFVGMNLRTQAKAYEASKLLRYKVRRGDNLTAIAHKFRTSIRRIKDSNKLRRNHIFVGQMLKIEMPDL